MMGKYSATTILDFLSPNGAWVYLFAPLFVPNTQGQKKNLEKLLWAHLCGMNNLLENTDNATVTTYVSTSHNSVVGHDL